MSQARQRGQPPVVILRGIDGEIDTKSIDLAECHVDGGSSNRSGGTAAVPSSAVWQEVWLRTSHNVFQGYLLPFHHAVLDGTATDPAVNVVGGLAD